MGYNISTTLRKQVIRLAKEWNSKVSYDDNISGRSSIFELIGIKAGRDEERKKKKIGEKPSLTNALRRVFGRVGDIERQRIRFYELYNPSMVPKDIRDQRPLILDPANPYNNLMHNFPADATALFRLHARRSQGQLDRRNYVSNVEMLF